MGDDKTTRLLHEELTYKIRGLFYDIANTYGLGMREKIYHNALIDSLTAINMSFQHEPQIPVLSWKDGRKIGSYIPDFTVEDRVIVELKSEAFISKAFVNQVYSYLRCTPYEVAFIVNYGGEQVEIKRFLFTNNRKPKFSGSI